MKFKHFKICALLILIYALLATITCWIAGTCGLPFFFAVYAIQAVISLVGIFTLNEGLIKERIKPGGKDQDPFGPLVISCLFLALLIVGALDVGRLHYSDSIPVSMQITALVFHALSWAGFLWCMKANTFFSSAVRLQADRQQQVVKTGPYRFVRHPGYVFASMATLTQALAFGSWLSLIPAVLFIGDLIYRTILEEQILQAGLDGYKQYAAEVRFRWLPGIW